MTELMLLLLLPYLLRCCGEMKTWRASPILRHLLPFLDFSPKIRKFDFRALNFRVGNNQRVFEVLEAFHEDEQGRIMPTTTFRGNEKFDVLVCPRYIASVTDRAEHPDSETLENLVFPTHWHSAKRFRALRDLVLYQGSELDEELDKFGPKPVDTIYKGREFYSESSDANHGNIYLSFKDDLSGVVIGKVIWHHRGQLYCEEIPFE